MKPGSWIVGEGGGGAPKIFFSQSSLLSEIQIVISILKNMWRKQLRKHSDKEYTLQKIQFSMLSYVSY